MEVAVGLPFPLTPGQETVSEPQPGALELLLPADAHKDITLSMPLSVIRKPMHSEAWVTHSWDEE